MDEVEAVDNGCTTWNQSDSAEGQARARSLPDGCVEPLADERTHATVGGASEDNDNDRATRQSRNNVRSRARHGPDPGAHFHPLAETAAGRAAISAC